MPEKLLNADDEATSSSFNNVVIASRVLTVSKGNFSTLKLFREFNRFLVFLAGMALFLRCNITVYSFQIVAEYCCVSVGVQKA
jgi:hypothetical protein